LVPITISFLLVVSASQDVATRTLSDTISILIAICGLLSRALISPSALVISIVASVSLFFLLLLAHARALLGGGDVKLMTAVACGFSPPELYHFVLFTALAGGVLAGLHLVLRRAFRSYRPTKPPPRGSSMVRRVIAAERWRIAREGPLPYGLAIACGGIATFGPRFSW
jgi:prepilin peptidase CpaA